MKVARGDDDRCGVKGCRRRSVIRAAGKELCEVHYDEHLEALLAADVARRAEKVPEVYPGQRTLEEATR